MYIYTDSDRQEAAKVLSEHVVFEVFAEKCASSFSSARELVLNVYKFSIDKLKAVLIDMPEYTLHDERHLGNMLSIIGDLLGKDRIEQLSTPDLMMILLSVFLHDIGMSVDRSQIASFKSILREEELVDDVNYFMDETKKFKSFCDSKPESIDEIKKQRNDGNTIISDQLEGYLISDFIRSTHAVRTKKIINDTFEDKILFDAKDLTADLIAICESHSYSQENMRTNLSIITSCDSKGTYYSPQFVAVILRLADIIDFDPTRTPEVLFAHLAVSHPISLNEWKKHRAIKYKTVKPDFLSFDATCVHPAIESAIKVFAHKLMVN